MEEHYVNPSISTRYEVVKEQNTNLYDLEEAMRFEFENDVIDMLLSKDYEVQGDVYLIEGNYDFEWIVYDYIMDRNTGERLKRIDTGYTFLPESDLLVPHDEA